ncbi:phosphopantetheine-binding protein [Prescottella defluvii]|nr:phosphopantetheine-binding protein [Prescottella defluvii]
MVPAAVVRLDHVPATPAGKLDRRALPLPEFGSDSEEYCAPSTPAEQAIADIVAEVLGLDRVGVHDSLFALGGDSIVAMQLVSRARAAGLGFTAREVFEHKTVAEIARVSVPIDSVPQDLLEELPGGGIGQVPLTPVMYEMAARGPFDDFHQSVLLTAPGDIDDRRLADTVRAVVDRHDMLRSRLESDLQGEPMLTVGLPAPSIRRTWSPG